MALRMLRQVLWKINCLQKALAHRSLNFPLELFWWLKDARGLLASSKFLKQAKLATAKLLKKSLLLKIVLLVSFLRCSKSAAPKGKSCNSVCIPQKVCAQGKLNILQVGRYAWEKASRWEAKLWGWNTSLWAWPHMQHLAYWALTDAFNLYIIRGTCDLAVSAATVAMVQKGRHAKHGHNKSNINVNYQGCTVARKKTKTIRACCGVQGSAQDRFLATVSASQGWWNATMLVYRASGAC